LETLLCDGFLDSEVTITDTSVVALRGSVWIANTADYNGDSNRPCPVIGAKVCALDYYSSSTVACDTTSSDGLKNRFFFITETLISSLFLVMLVISTSLAENEILGRPARRNRRQDGASAPRQRPERDARDVDE
jgi:hypothetical protein